jgi:UDP-glucose 4-epimerase
MLTHLFPSPRPPSRAVVLGSAGFVGRATLHRLRSAGVATLGLARTELDLTDPAAGEKLRQCLRPDDALIFAAARAPCKDVRMLIDNLKMAEAVCSAVCSVPPAHLVYISSDAVYRDSAEPLTESSCAEPASAHGVMHLAREVLLRAAYAGSLALLRPTLIYGADDPHNGYGPNRFRRLAAEGREITLFGQGEERRDHVSIHDVAGLACAIVLRRSAGTLNAVSGETASFRELAEFVAERHSPPAPVRFASRAGAMPHNGYRPFDASAIARSFPDFRSTPWREGIAELCRPPHQAAP